MSPSPFWVGYENGRELGEPDSSGYFAAKAMAAMLVSDLYESADEDHIAQLAYALAEKMMEMKDEQGS